MEIFEPEVRRLRVSELFSGEKEVVKARVMKELDHRLFTLGINLGAYSQDIGDGEKQGEDICEPPDNADMIVLVIGKMIDVAFQQSSSREEFLQALKKIPVRFDFDQYKDYEDFTPLRKAEEPLSEFLAEDITDIVYKKT